MLDRYVIPLFLLLLTSIVIPPALSAQNQQPLSLHWSEGLTFQEAIYPDTVNRLPWYSVRIPIDQGNLGKIATIELIGTQYIPLTAEEKTQLTGKKFTNEIIVEHSNQIERKQPYLVMQFIPIRRNPDSGILEKLSQFTPRLLFETASSSPLKTTNQSYVGHSVLANGRWFKIRVKESGIHKLTYDDLVKLGLSQPENCRIYGNGGKQLPYDSSLDRPDDLIENPIYMEKGSDGLFNSGDYLLFYAEGPVTWSYDSSKGMFRHHLHRYSDYSYYFVTSDLGAGQKISTHPAPGGPPEKVITSYDDIAYREKDSLNLIKSGRQWCWRHFALELRWGFSFDFPNRNSNAPVKVAVGLWARSSRTSSNSKFYLQDGETRFETVELPGVHTNNYEALYASTSLTFTEFVPSRNNFVLNIQFVPSNPAAEGWLDFLTLHTRSHLRYNATPLRFRDMETVGADQINQFKIEQANANVQVWDVTQSTVPFRITTTNQGSNLTFKANTLLPHEYLLFDPTSSGFPIPEYNMDGLREIPNQDLHGIDPEDMIILVHDDLRSYAQELADLHYEQDGITSVLISPDQIYNEFSSGIPDVSAIRNFLKRFYDQASANNFRLKYFLLFGDGSYDNKNVYHDHDYKTCLPTFQSLESLYPTSSYLSDDFFGLLDDGEEMEPGLLDLGIGRLPVISENDAAIMVEKIKQYKSQASLGDWRNLICFIGDDEDGNGHMRDANTLADILDSKYPAFNIEKIFLDAYQQISVPAGERYPEVNRAITDRIRKGALIMNYLGHGSERGLAHEEILTISDIKNWTNWDKLPLFMTATCEFSRYDDMELVSAGEWVLLNPNGGGIALLTTTRLVYSSPNYRLNREFYDYVFELNSSGLRYTLGDIIRLTKNDIGNELNKLSFTLLGDPALTLNFPKYQVVMTEINNRPVSEFSDTLKALSEVEVGGILKDLQGNLMEDFTGFVMPTVYDKPVTLTNLANDGGPIMEFNVQNNILFKGKASVNQGEFHFSFIVPKDISYNIGSGKFSFYSFNQEADASGVNRSILIGGSSDQTIMDQEGPEVRMFMNDTTFVSGGITDENPVLVVRVSDNYGINTVGNGIGHDITAVIDGNQQDVLVLNDYYESDLDQFRSGTIRYPMANLEPGEHTIHMKVWDILNNSTEADVRFIVSDSEDLKIDHLLNFPNPFTTHTDFYFEHNQAYQEIEALIQVFTISGRLVKSFEYIRANETQIGRGGYRVGPIPWDGLDDFGDRIGRGTYIYRVKIRTTDGKKGEAYQKLVILR